MNYTIKEVRRYMRIGSLVMAVLLSMPYLLAQVPFADRSSFARIDNTGSNHGISFGDFNNDDLEDVYISVREIGIPNKLYLNRGNGRFEEMAASAGVDDRGVTTAAVWGDINNDGFLDLYVGNTGSENRLYLNKGDLTFEDITLTADVGDRFDPRSVQFADIDNDGYLDIYVHNYKTENVLYINDQDNTFSDKTEESKAKNIDPAMGTLFFDIDADGDQDLFALNDGGENVFFVNNGDGTFEDRSEASGLGFHCSCMGVDFGDYDLDGDYDLYITNYGENFFMENNGDGTFIDVADPFDVDDWGVGWGTFWFDYDNDGDQDIYLANHQFLIARPNMLYRNDDALEFVPVSTDTNVESPFASFGSASADINNDGRIDMMVANWGTTAINQLFVNDQEEHHSILIKAKGTVSNASAFGTTIKVRTGDKVQIDQVTGATGYASQNSMVLHFGLGEYEQIDEIMITWPSGLQESYLNLEVDKYYTVTEGEGFETKEFAPATLLDVDFRLDDKAAYPNPFSNSVFIPVGKETVEELFIEFYSLRGERVKNIQKMVQSNGVWGFSWKGVGELGKPLNDGIYLYKVYDQSNHAILSGRVLLDR